MSTVTIGSGVGATATAKLQDTWGGTFMSTAQRTIIFKNAKLTYDPHYVQGGTYLAAGQLAALGSARVLTWQDAKFTLTGDVHNINQALLIACALGTSATLTQLGTTTAYALGGVSGADGSAPDKNSTWFDFQLGIPTDDGTLNPASFHSCVIQKAEWVFDRAGVVTYSYDCIAQYVEFETDLLSPTEPTSQQPFSMATSTGDDTGSMIAVGTYNSEEIVAGIKKATFTLDRKLASEADRMYLGFQYQQSPVTNDYVDLGVALDTDYTVGAKSALFDKFLTGANTSVLCQAVGEEIGSSGYNNEFALQTPYFVIDSGAEPSPDGAQLVNNTITGTAKISPANDPWLHSVLQTADTTF